MKPLIHTAGRIRVFLPFAMTKLVEAVKYTDCIFAEGSDFPNKCSVYDTKQSDDEAPGFTLAWSSST